jgi:flagellin-like protein
MRKGISTIIATIILVVITIGLISTAYLYFSGLIGGMTEGAISLVDAYCVAASDDIIAIVKNEGTADISSLNCIINGAACNADGNENTDCDLGLSPGDICTYNITDTIPDSINQIRIIAANSVGGAVQCR